MCGLPKKLAALQRAGVGAIIRMDEDDKNREIYASGVRNSVGLDFNPVDKSLWFTDNQVDGMGGSELWIPLVRRWPCAHGRV
jgi:glucose/arabinose dehydrogenase